MGIDAEARCRSLGQPVCCSNSVSHLHQAKRLMSTAQHSSLRLISVGHTVLLGVVSRFGRTSGSGARSHAATADARRSRQRCSLAAGKLCGQLTCIVRAGLLAMTRESEGAVAGQPGRRLLSRAGRALADYPAAQDAQTVSGGHSLGSPLLQQLAGTMSKARGPRQGSPHACVARRPTSVTQLLLDLSFARLLVAVLEVALGPITAALGPWRLACRVFLALRRLLLRSIGYMAAPAQLTPLRQLGAGLDVRRWHVAAGEADRRRAALEPTQLPFLLQPHGCRCHVVCEL